MPLKVLVTGAGGRTGSMVVLKLLQGGTDTFEAKAMVRSQASEDGLKEKLGDLAAGAKFVHGNITEPESLKEAFKDQDAVVIVTSSAPQISKSSLFGVIGSKMLSLGASDAKPTFWFPEGQGPKEVDFIGQCVQVDAAREAGVKHIVLISSMGGTQPDHFLNTNMGNLCLWKRRSEKYLMASGVPYTIIHPGGLLPQPPANTPAPGGKRQLYVSVDDVLMNDGLSHSTIPREDVAEVTVNCLLEPECQGRSFDLGSGPEGEGTVYAGDLKALLAPLEGKNCSYETPKLPEE